MSELLYYPLGSQQPLPIDLYSEPHPQRPQQNATGDFDFTSFETIGGQCTSQQPQDIQIQAFEADIDALDAILAQGSLDIDPTFLTNPSGIFEHIRTGTPTRGAPSTFTVSSESASAYESGYNESDSAYTYQSASELSALYEPFTTMNFQALGVTDSDFSTQSPNSAHSSPNSNIMNMALYSPPSYPPRGSYSDYEPTHIRVAPSSASDYYSQMSVPIKYPSSAIQATVSPANVSTQLPSAHQLQTAVLGSQQRDLKQENVQRSMNAKESKRKYQCPNCPRSFARAFNLKTHIQTHDPNRSKPYACQHKSCGRAFSRKHDLTRHLISIHRSDAESVGIAGSTRARCEECGASSVSNDKVKCDCQAKK